MPRKINYKVKQTSEKNDFREEKKLNKNLNNYQRSDRNDEKYALNCGDVSYQESHKILNQKLKNRKTVSRKNQSYKGNRNISVCDSDTTLASNNSNKPYFKVGSKYDSVRNRNANSCHRHNSKTFNNKTEKKRLSGFNHNAGLYHLAPKEIPGDLMTFDSFDSSDGADELTNEGEKTERVLKKKAPKEEKKKYNYDIDATLDKMEAMNDLVDLSNKMKDIQSQQKQLQKDKERVAHKAIEDAQKLHMKAGQPKSSKFQGFIRNMRSMFSKKPQDSPPEDSNESPRDKSDRVPSLDLRPIQFLDIEGSPLPSVIRDLHDPLNFDSILEKPYLVDNDDSMYSTPSVRSLRPPDEPEKDVEKMSLTSLDLKNQADDLEEKYGMRQEWMKVIVDGLYVPMKEDFTKAQRQQAYRDALRRSQGPPYLHYPVNTSRFKRWTEKGEDRDSVFD